MRIAASLGFSKRVMLSATAWLPLETRPVIAHQGKIDCASRLSSGKLSALRRREAWFSLAIPLLEPRQKAVSTGFLIASLVIGILCSSCNGSDHLIGSVVDAAPLASVASSSHGEVESSSALTDDTRIVAEDAATNIGEYSSPDALFMREEWYLEACGRTEAADYRLLEALSHFLAVQSEFPNGREKLVDIFNNEAQEIPFPCALVSCQDIWPLAQCAAVASRHGMVRAVGINVLYSCAKRNGQVTGARIALDFALREGICDRMQWTSIAQPSRSKWQPIFKPSPCTRMCLEEPEWCALMRSSFRFRSIRESWEPR